MLFCEHVIVITGNASAIVQSTNGARADVTGSLISLRDATRRLYKHLVRLCTLASITPELYTLL